MMASRCRLYLAAICLALLSSAAVSSSHALHSGSEPSDRVLKDHVPHLKAKPTPAPTPRPTSVKPTPAPAPEAPDSEDNQDLDDLLSNMITFDFTDGSTGTDEVGTSNVGAWTPVTLSEDTARVALDAVRYRNNYASGVTTRLCLHRINLIRNRLVDDLASYLFSVDGCESTKITPTGRCDIYYCKLATYELKVAQKTANKDIYIVQSIFKTLTQKAISELMAPSNLDFNDYTDDDGTDTSGGNRERALAQAPQGSKPQSAAATGVASTQEQWLLWQWRTENEHGEAQLHRHQRNGD
ncbi:hypothetical protein Gpo141_00000073 [Globisporangium polare]